MKKKILIFLFSLLSLSAYPVVTVYMNEDRVMDKDFSFTYWYFGFEQTKELHKDVYIISFIKTYVLYT